MPCCGQKTSSGFNNLSAPARRTTSVEARPRYRYSIYFEYVGQTGLTVFGGSTNKKYRFDGAGARVEIDPRDRPSLAKVPNLKEVPT